MKRLTLMLSASLVLGACGQSPHCASNDAEGLVKTLETKSHFKSLLTKVVERAHTARMVQVRDGFDGQDKLEQAINVAVKRYGAEWGKTSL